jgi:hypothetical protein
MELCVQINAAIAYDRETIIGVSGLEKSGQDDSTCRNSIKNQRVDFPRAEDHRKIGTSEGTDAVLGDDHFILERCDRIRDSAKRFPKQLLMLLRGLDGAEECIPRTDLRQARAKTDRDVDDGHATIARMIKDIPGSR